jgi:hypothetical protein
MDTGNGNGRGALYRFGGDLNLELVGSGGVLFKRGHCWETGPQISLVDDVMTTTKHRSADADTVTNTSSTRAPLPFNVVVFRIVHAYARYLR